MPYGLIIAAAAGYGLLIVSDLLSGRAGTGTREEP